MLFAAGEAQLILPLVERPYQVLPALKARAFRLDSTTWACTARIDAGEWVDYAFDSLLEVQFRLYGEEGQVVAETLLLLPVSAQLQSHFHWLLRASLAGKEYYLGVFPTPIPEKAVYTRLYLPENVVAAYPLTADVWLEGVVTLMDAQGQSYQLTPQEEGWKVFFVPARIDTAWPPLPYVFTTVRPRWTQTACAWHLKGDTTQIFWTCTLSSAAPKKVRLNPVWQAQAQRLFSGQKPGDRTDFGLIYAAWGPPSVRLYTISLETWVYTGRKLSFTFERQGQAWVLQRRIEYQAVWK